ncbi:CBS domain-containing protein [Actinomadura viridis]|uniref:CBS domain-containing protein n=1 Tax=Actinomadura viridis TaxID=58110 RepID=A0A931DDP1_9ACTN|nr:CBS domain-containing protein [Actinomadura viridis]MBG6089174.1 CBS domain-containing protein [Actinomadura viridis]
MKTTETAVKAVMTTDVVTVGERTPFKEIVELLRRHRLHAVPVLDGDGRVAGIVSDSDLIMKEADPTSVEEDHLLAGPRRHREYRKAAGATAAEVMTSPAITVTPEAGLRTAAGRMRRHRIGRLPVTDPVTGALLGIVSRSDLLGVYDRPDAEIERDVLGEISGLATAPAVTGLEVEVRQGRVDVHGKVDLRSRIPSLMHQVRRVEGVVSARSRLQWRTDDLITAHYPYM